jgi:hypothetical protein
VPAHTAEITVNGALQAQARCCYHHAWAFSMSRRKIMRILIIEDNPDIAANLGDYLE